MRIQVISRASAVLLAAGVFACAADGARGNAGAPDRLDPAGPGGRETRRSDARPGSLASGGPGSGATGGLPDDALCDLSFGQSTEAAVRTALGEPSSESNDGEVLLLVYAYADGSVLELAFVDDRLVGLQLRTHGPDDLRCRPRTDSDDEADGGVVEWGRPDGGWFRLPANDWRPDGGFYTRPDISWGRPDGGAW